MAATQSARTGRARLKAGGGRARAERTENMDCMLVTLDVSRRSGWLNADARSNISLISVTPDVFQLEKSSLKFAKSRNSPLMSVIDETSQPEMGPYVLRAVARSSTHIRTAACSSALVAKGADDASICASKRSAAAREE